MIPIGGDYTAYHHENLKDTLILKAIELLDSGGEASFSLRGLAESCGVSRAAPYRHFRDKADLIEGVKAYITDAFTAWFVRAVEQIDPADPYRVSRLSIEYIRFFMRHPVYHRFLNSHRSFSMVISQEGITCDFAPFELFRDYAQQFLRSMGIDARHDAQNIIAMWTIVEGLTALSVSPNVELKDEAIVERIINQNFRLHGG